jgi:hypothetical protein
LKRQVPLLITFVVGWVLIFSTFIPRISNWGEEFSIFFDIIAVFAFILGGGNLVKVHGDAIYRRSAGWGYSMVALVGFVGTFVIGMLKMGSPAGIQGDVTMTGSQFAGIYEYVFQPLAATMFALLAFYVASASYRAFRAKNAEATILLVAAFVILMGRTAIGDAATGWVPERFAYLRIPEIANWIMNVPNLSGQRAIMIGIALGTISTSLKLILGIERSYLGADND